MHSIDRAVGTFVWFLSQAISVGGLGAIYFLGPFAICCVVLYFSYRGMSAPARRSLRVLVALPALWIVIGLWGGAFWLDWQKKPFVPNPEWVHRVPQTLAWIATALTAFFVLYLKGARVFAAVFGVLNLYFVWTMLFLTGMAITGVWL